MSFGRRQPTTNVHLKEVSALEKGVGLREMSALDVRLREGTFFLGGRKAGASEGRVISESEHQKGRAIPLCELFKGEGGGGSHILSRRSQLRTRDDGTIRRLV